MTDWRRLNRGTVVDTRPQHRWIIGQRFRRLRKKIRLTQKHLGEFIGLCRQQVSKVECCRVRLHPRSWNRFEVLERAHRQSKRKLPTHWD
jgi:hypothetical protein